jgi:hypothetical protein
MCCSVSVLVGIGVNGDPNTIGGVLLSDSAFQALRSASRPLPNVRSSTRMTSGFTNSERPSPRGASGLASIYAPCSSGLATPTWNRQCGILKPSRSQHVRDEVNENSLSRAPMRTVFLPSFPQESARSGVHW